MGRPAKFAPKFRDAAVEMVRESGRPIAEVARELGVNEGTLGNCISRDRKACGEVREPEITESVTLPQNARIPPHPRTPPRPGADRNGL